MFAKNLVAEVRIIKLVTILFLIGFVFMGTSHAATVYVDDSAAGGGDGSIGTPFQTVTAGLTAALGLGGSNTVAVAGGSYTEAGTLGIFNASDLTLQGGFNAAFDTQNPAANVTTVNGPAATNGGIIQVATSTNIVIDGLTLAGGNAALVGVDVDGGGIGISGVGITATISNCIIRDCVALDDGGGAAVNGGSVFETAVVTTTVVDFINVEFNNCSAGDDAGGVQIAAGAQVDFDDCRFIDCSSVDHGGALTTTADEITEDDGTTVDLTDCQFQGCTAGEDGGAGRFGCPMVIRDCNVSQCVATVDCGGFQFGRGFNYEVSDCLVKDCTAGDDGGGIVLETNSSGLMPTELTLEDCIIDSCVATGDDGGGMFMQGNAFLNMNRCGIYNCRVTVDEGAALDVDSVGANPPSPPGRNMPQEVFITNSVFANNENTGDDWIIFIETLLGKVSFCTFYNNTSVDESVIRVRNRTGEEAVGTSVETEIANCLFVDNDTSAGNDEVIRDEFATVDYCLFEGNLTGTETDILASTGDGASPLFGVDVFDPPHVGNIAGTVNFTNVGANDFSVFLGSANIDVGVDIPSVVVDFIGNPRSAGAAPDIGAYEFTLPAPPSSDVEDWSLYR